MQLTCTEHHIGPRPTQLRGRRRALRRGNAEIETLLVILFVVLPILFIVVFAGSLGLSRLQNTFNAENNAYAEVVAGNATASTEVVPITAADQPALPTRFALSDTVVTARQTQGQQSALFAPVRIEDKAWFLDSSWHYPSSGEDQTAIHDWFNAYVDQDHSDALDYALGISPPGPP